MTKKKTITAEEFDRRFDAGEDMTEYLDMDSAWIEPPIPNRTVRVINAELPDWVVDVLDHEAHELNVPRRSVINTWLAEKAREYLANASDA